MLFIIVKKLDSAISVCHDEGYVELGYILLINLFNTYLLNSCCVPGTVLKTGDIKRIKIDKVPSWKTVNR